MVGQTNLLRTLSLMTKIPRFIILVGDIGSGKRTLANTINKLFIKGELVECGNKIDDVRDVIENSYKSTDKVVYVFSTADDMSEQAKNALLKVTEEPPKSAYFIMCVTSESNVLYTLRSRASVFMMEPYSKGQLAEIRMPKTENDQLALKISSTPGQYLRLCETDVKQLYDFCTKTYLNIASVSGSNALKITSSIKTKKDGDGYDVVDFFNGLKLIATDMAKDGTLKDVSVGIKITNCINSYIAKLKIRGIKIDSLVDMFILDVRMVLRGV